MLGKGNATTTVYPVIQGHNSLIQQINRTKALTVQNVSKHNLTIHLQKQTKNGQQSFTDIF